MNSKERNSDMEKNDKESSKNDTKTPPKDVRTTPEGEKKNEDPVVLNEIQICMKIEEAYRRFYESTRVNQVNGSASSATQPRRVRVNCICHAIDSDEENWDPDDENNYYKPHELVNKNQSTTIISDQNEEPPEPEDDEDQQEVRYANVTETRVVKISFMEQLMRIMGCGNRSQGQNN